MIELSLGGQLMIYRSQRVEERKGVARRKVRGWRYVTGGGGQFPR